MAKGMHRDSGAMDSANAVIVKFPCMNMMESSSSLNQSSGRQLPYIMRKANIVSTENLVANCCDIYMHAGQCSSHVNDH